MLATLDALCVLGARVVAVGLTSGRAAGAALMHDHLGLLLATSCVFGALFYGSGLYERARLLRVRAAAVPVTFAVAVGVAVTALVSHEAVPALALAPRAALVFGGVVATAILLVRIAFAEANRRGVAAVRCLVVGTPEHAERVARLVRDHRHTGLRLVGFVATGGAAGRESVGGIEVLGGLDVLEREVAARRSDRIVFGADAAHLPALRLQLRSLRFRGVLLVDYASLHEELAREIPIGDIDEEWLLRAAMNSSRVHIRRLKRLSDLGLSLLLLPAFLLVVPAVALLIRWDSPGPVFFRQERLGLGGKRFHVIKFRTMRADAEKLTGAVWSTDGDPRITRVGRVLRKFRIDELPQLLNVLAGDMSLVGPRPERPELSDKILASVPLFEERLVVRPGVTGWAQVMAPYASTIADSGRKLQFDLYYAKHMSMWLDLLVLVKTVRTVLFGRERVQGGMRAGRQADAAPVLGNERFGGSRAA